MSHATVNTTRVDGGILLVCIDRPAQRNAVDRPTAAALVAAFAGFDADPTLLVAVLHGAGGTFCAGADLAAVASGVAASLARRNVTEPVESGAPGPMGPTRMALSKPVIAAVEGHAVAGGLELACWCDMRVAGASATFGVFCRRWGVPLIDGGCVRLPRLIGQSRALDLILTGRAVGAAEALAIGLANRVVPDGEALSAAIALARQIAAFPPQCMRADRRTAIDQWSLPEYEPVIGAICNENGCTASGALAAPVSSKLISPKSGLALEFHNSIGALQNESQIGAARFARDRVGRGGSFAAFNSPPPSTLNSSPPPSSSVLTPIPAAGDASPPTTTSTGIDQPPARKIRAVLFDLGGVILDSPIDVIEAHTRSLALPRFALNAFIGRSPAFHRLERGELDERSFLPELEAEAAAHPVLGARHAAGTLDLAGLFARMGAVAVRADMLAVVAALRAAGYRTAALTNNWKARASDARGEFVSTIDGHFDLVVESCVVGARKPEAAFFRRACERLRVAPDECLFLDDIAANCRGAAALGMRTIRVPTGTEYRRALLKLFALCPDAAARMPATAVAEPAAKL